MKQVGEQYRGKELVGSKLWLFRFDKQTTEAAGAEPGAGLWVEAQVVGYNDKTGEHEVGGVLGAAAACHWSGQVAQPAVASAVAEQA